MDHSKICRDRRAPSRIFSCGTLSKTCAFWIKKRTLCHHCSRSSRTVWGAYSARYGIFYILTTYRKQRLLPVRSDTTYRVTYCRCIDDDREYSSECTVCSLGGSRVRVVWKWNSKNEQLLIYNCSFLREGTENRNRMNRERIRPHTSIILYIVVYFLSHPQDEKIIFDNCTKNRKKSIPIRFFCAQLLIKNTNFIQKSFDNCPFFI